MYAPNHAQITPPATETERVPPSPAAVEAQLQEDRSRPILVLRSPLHARVAVVALVKAKSAIHRRTQHTITPPNGILPCPQLEFDYVVHAVAMVMGHVPRLRRRVNAQILSAPLFVQL